MKNALFRFVFLVMRWFRPKLDTPASSTFLVLQYQMPLGCCVHGTPVYAALKEELRTSQPAPKIIVATRGMGAAVLQHDPDVDEIIVTDDPTPGLASKWRVARQIRSQLRARKLQPSFILQDASTKAGSNALFAALLRLAPTGGFANAPELYDQHFAYDPNLSLIDNNLRLAEAEETLDKPRKLLSMHASNVRNLYGSCSTHQRVRYDGCMHLQSGQRRRKQATQAAYISEE